MFIINAVFYVLGMTLLFIIEALRIVYAIPDFIVILVTIYRVRFKKIAEAETGSTVGVYPYPMFGAVTYALGRWYTGSVLNTSAHVTPEVTKPTYGNHRQQEQSAGSRQTPTVRRSYASGGKRSDFYRSN